MNSRFTRICLFFLLIIGFTACTPESGSPASEVSPSIEAPTPGVDAASTKVPIHLTSSPQPTRTPAPTKTPTVMPSPTEKVARICPVLKGDVPFDLSIEQTDFFPAALEYINAGGDPQQLAEQMQASETYQDSEIHVEDMDEDSIPEITIILSDPYQTETVQFNIYQCFKSNYHLVGSFPLTGQYFSRLEYSNRLFSDQPPYLIFRTDTRTGWVEYIYGIGWSGSEWRIIQIASEWAPNSIVFYDQNQDGIKEAFISLPSSTSPGGGIPRTIIVTYQSTGGDYQFISRELPPGENRVQYIGDAEQAMKAGNPLLAIYYYRIAAENPDMDSWPTRTEEELNQTALAKPYQQAFSYFRIIATWVYLERPDLAEDDFETMNTAFPSGTPGNEFVVAARELLDQYKNNPQTYGAPYMNACRSAVDLFSKTYPGVFVAHLGYWGSSNPSYSEPLDMCTLK